MSGTGPEPEAAETQGTPGTHPLEPESVSDSRGSGRESISDSGRRRPESDWERRRRLAVAFGDVLPEQTTDDAATRGGKGDDWYREQVPPHHG